MNRVERRWAIVLAGGDGTRLASLTTSGGVTVPKQFCTVNGGPTLLQLALRRAERAAGRGRVSIVVAPDHRQWWEEDLRGNAGASVVVQPHNRGTAAGVLLPLTAICAQDGDATVFILPSDHWVGDERTLNRELRRAGRAVDAEPDTVVLLGIEPDAPDPGYGWILPGPSTAPGVFGVESFIEKPAPRTALELLAAGAVWNSFLIAARARTLWTLYERRLWVLWHRMRIALDPDAHAMYADLPRYDFSRDMLVGAEPLLRLLRVPECGWTDLGTPKRVVAMVERARTCRGSRRSWPRGRVDLVWALAGHAWRDGRHAVRREL
jgi:mannose-1-phosphate guanylyltransferase